MVSLLGSTLRLSVPPRTVFTEAPVEVLDGPSDRLIVAAISAAELGHVLRFFSIANLCQVDLFFEPDCLRVRGSWTEYVLARVPQDEALRQFGMAEREHVS